MSAAAAAEDDVDEGAVPEADRSDSAVDDESVATEDVAAAAAEHCYIEADG